MWRMLFLFGMMSVSGPARAQSPAWSEEFNALDPGRWEIQLYSFPANGCNMTAANVTVQESILHLRVERNADPALPKSCNAGEIGSRRFFNYGLFLVRLKAPAIRGGVSAFFLMNQWQPVDWEHKEIDIELLGKATTAAQFTTHDFQNGGRDWKRAAATLDLGADYSTAFHEYGILWLRDRVEWFFDGRRVHVETRYVPRVPLQIRMNINMGDATVPGIAQWLGPRDDSVLPLHAEYDWIRYYPAGSVPAAFQGKK